jgi:hypothetical protein
MAILPPNLDDRTFADLLEESRRLIGRECPAWTDLSASDPGVTLLEAFAYLTEQMIYRLNRLPEKAYIEFLRLIGVRLQPPAAAAATLRFSVDAAPGQPLEIPRGTRVTLKRSGGVGEGPVFVTTRDAAIAPGQSAVEVPSLHAEIVSGELAGLGTGLPGQSVDARRTPLVAPTGTELDLVVAVEAVEDELDERAPALEWEGKPFRIWREVENFTDLGADRFVYVADRLTGSITFAPPLTVAGTGHRPVPLAEVPATGRQIRLWYARGGGPEGNVGAGLIDTLKDPLPQIKVTNPATASGGRAAETLENALRRGPQELHSLKRAVTAGDFELVAMGHPGVVARAKAFTKAALWRHAAPGTVEVLLVPDVPKASDGERRVTTDLLRQHQTPDALKRIREALDEKRGLGTALEVQWTRCKEVAVEAKVVVHREEDPKAVEQRLLKRLNQIINPLRTDLRPRGWPFGEPLRAFHVYETVRSEPGVSYVEGIQFVVGDVPAKDVRSVSQDDFQPGAWYAVAGDTLYRSLTDGAGWEAAGRFPGESAQLARIHALRPGVLAVATKLDKGGARVHVSEDCGETWTALASTAFAIDDMAWGLRDGDPVLFLATDVGLYELVLRADRAASPVQVLVDPADPDRGFWAVAAAADAGGRLNVAVAGRGTGGVFVSSDGGRSKTFRAIGLKGEDVRVLAVERDGPRSFLWAGLAAAGENDPGKGCFRTELMGSQDAAEGWKKFGKGWKGGSVKALAFQGSNVLAATFSAGVLSLARASTDPEWKAPDFVGCDLPLRDSGRLQPVEDIAVDPSGRTIFAAGPGGVFASVDGGTTYCKRSESRFETVALPPTWLFCSGEHRIRVVREDEARRD